MPGNNHSLDNLAAHVRALPRAEQLELLRMIAPEIVAHLDDADRAALVTEINQAIVRQAAPGASRR